WNRRRVARHAENVRDIRADSRLGILRALLQLAHAPWRELDEIPERLIVNCGPRQRFNDVIDRPLRQARGRKPAGQIQGVAPSVVECGIDILRLRRVACASEPLDGADSKRNGGRELRNEDWSARGTSDTRQRVEGAQREVSLLVVLKQIG